MATRARALPPQSLSGREYALISLALIVLGIGLLVLFVIFVPRLLPADILNEFFYIVLVVWGLVCALVLFGVMKSYARVTYKRLGGAIELGGPAAFAALVVVGGFWLVPHGDTFDLTVRPHGPGTPLITQGKIRMELGNLAITRDVNSSGEVDFKGIPHKYRGSTIKVLPLIDGYDQTYQSVALTSDVVDLSLVKPATLLKGRIVPAPSSSQNVKVLIEGEDGEQVPDTYGRFQFVVHKNPGATVRVNVCSNGRSIFDDYKAVGSEVVEILTHKPGASCNGQ